MTDTVAIFSPHDDIRLLLRSLLRLHHYRVAIEGSSPGELRSLPSAVDGTIVLDVDLEEVGWFQALESLRAARPGLRFLLVTPSRSPRTDQRAQTAGVSAVLRRPFAMRQLLEAMQGVGAVVEVARAPAGPAP